MRLYVDVLGWLHFIWGVFGALVGVSLLVLALGTSSALGESAGPADQAAIWLFVICGLTLIVAGAGMMFVARGLSRRRPAGRFTALVLAVPNLIVVPFGTALAVFTFWVLLNDDARREFGRPPRGPMRMEPVEHA